MHVQNTIRNDAQALELLRGYYDRIEQDFRDFADLDPYVEPAAAVALVGRCGGELERLIELEAEIFYPAVRAALWDDERVDEAEVEQATFKILIAALRRMSPEHVKYGPTFKVLGNYFQHYRREQENRLFRPLAGAALDWEKLFSALHSTALAQCDDIAPFEAETGFAPIGRDGFRESSIAH